MVDRVIRIVLDSSGVRQGTQEIEGQLGKVERNTRRATQTLGGLGRAARAVVGFLGVREVIRYGDAWVNTGNRIRLATDSQEEFNAVQRELVSLSNETRSSLESTVELYSRSERATRALGVSQQEVIDLTRTVNQTLQISGATAAEAAGSTVQFAQGLGSGALRGQELNSVLEQNARLANILADSFGVGVGQLRALGEAGELTSERILLALQGSADEVQGEFDQLNVSVGAAFTVLNNSLLEFFGRLGEVTGGTNRLSSAILRVAEFIRGPLLQGANDFLDSFGAASDRILAGFSRTDDLLEVLGFNASEVFGFIGRALAELPINVVFAIQIATTEIVGFFERLETRTRLVANTIAGTFNEAFGRDEAVERNIANRRRLEGELTEELARIEDERNLLVAESLREQEALREQFALRRLETSDFDLSAGGDRTRGGDVGALSDDQQEFIDALQQTAVELAIETSLLDEAEGVLLRYRTAIEAAALGEADFVEQALSVVDTINAQTDALEAAQNRAADSELLDSLQAELDLLGLTNRERFIEVQLRELSAEATQEQIDKTRELAGELFDQQEALNNQVDTLQSIADQAARNIQDTFADFLFDPFEEGLDGLVSNFSDALRRMAAEILAQQIITSFLNAFGGGQGFGQILGAAFGGQRQMGGGVRADQSFLVGERGPELFTPPTAGNITPTNQVAQMAPQVQIGGPTIINAFDDRAIVGAFNRGGGSQAVLNIVGENPTAFRQILGVN